ncbi:MAG: hypothetical protein ACYCS8_17930, partial [Acidithiobacillus sp.]
AWLRKSVKVVSGMNVLPSDDVHQSVHHRCVRQQHMHIADFPGDSSCLDLFNQPVGKLKTAIFLIGVVPRTG